MDRCSAPTAGQATSAGLAERGGARRPRGDRGRQGPRRRATRPGRESRQSVFPAERGPPPSQRSSGLRAARGHVGPHKGAAAGARGPRVKRRVRPHSARSREVARSEEEVLSEEEMLSEQVARNEQLVGSKEVARNEQVVGSKEVVRSEAVTENEAVTESEEAAPTEEVAQNEEMAAAGLSVTVTHSNEKHDLHVTPQQGSSEPIVQDLAQVVEEATGVPLPFQKLIFKGQSLKEMEKPLSAVGIQNGCRVMLIGKKNRPEEEVELKKLKSLEKSVEKIADQLEELNKELIGIQQGFLAKDLQAEALCKLDRKVKATIEQFMKILEEIDALVLPENFKDSRLKRKGLVKRVQALLAECDTVEQNICQEAEQLQSTNLALAK
ncbi:BAG family molecular chaperone regulator 1 isoform X1 [Myotis myotis]|uniref:BAG family molecular chaperone regulator 1 n=1 Tax=Myotis myotis TaxID=51298 RepID=A0A7J7UMX2_MYOMY|nr:BAG family molecular chaperone regulator 1 isoform X1 [Myotis myotis]KAF6314198.1 BAG cochaperone 1 [Myotis myotis]